jgi:hypothetical protein
LSIDSTFIFALLLSSFLPFCCLNKFIKSKQVFHFLQLVEQQASIVPVYTGTTAVSDEKTQKEIMKKKKTTAQNSYKPSASSVRLNRQISEWNNNNNNICNSPGSVQSSHSSSSSQLSPVFKSSFALSHVPSLVLESPPKPSKSLSSGAFANIIPVVRRDRFDVFGVGGKQFIRSDTFFSISYLIFRYSV